MTNELSEVMPNAQQDEIWVAAILGHHHTVWEEFQSILAEMKAQPGGMTKEQVAVSISFIKSQMEWLRAHGINAAFTIHDAQGIDGLKAGDQL
jgi:hypothetical protein